MEKILKTFNSFKDAEKDDIEYYKNLDPNKKLEELEIIRLHYFNFINLPLNERQVQRVFEVADRKSSKTK